MVAFSKRKLFFANLTCAGNLKIDTAITKLFHYKKKRKQTGSSPHAAKDEFISLCLSALLKQIRENN